MLGVKRNFSRSFTFPAPNASKRVQLWRQAFNGSYELGKDVDFDAIAEKYMIAGGAINNILRYCVLVAAQHQRPIRQEDILMSLRKEWHKEGNVLEDVAKGMKQLVDVQVNIGWSYLSDRYEQTIC